MTEERIGGVRDGTVELLKGGVHRAGVGAALAEISGWEGRLAASGDPDLVAVAQTLAKLRAQLEGVRFDPVTVGALMRSLGEQVEGVAGSDAGARVAERLSQLGSLLGEQGDAVSKEGMKH